MQGWGICMANRHANNNQTFKHEALLRGERGTATSGTCQWKNNISQASHNNRNVWNCVEWFTFFQPTDVLRLLVVTPNKFFKTNKSFKALKNSTDKHQSRHHVNLKTDHKLVVSDAYSVYTSALPFLRITLVFWFIVATGLWRNVNMMDLFSMKA